MLKKVKWWAVRDLNPLPTMPGIVFQRVDNVLITRYQIISARFLADVATMGSIDIAS